MIVDDEPIIRKGLANFIAWDSIECKVTCECTNGLEAKELIPTQKPDIIISDIKMPGMDGIELSKYIYENYPEIKVILLTGYSEFKYAQSAIKFNVVDFVLKPSSNEKITLAIEKSKKLIFDDRLKVKKISYLNEKLDQNVTQLQEKFFYDYINGILQNKTRIQSEMDNLKINLKSYHVLFFKFNINPHNQLITNGENKKNILLEIKKFISIIFKDYLHYNVTINCTSLCTVLNFESSFENDPTSIISNKSKELLHFFSNFMNIPISLGISDLHNELEEVPIAYEESIESLSQKFYDDDIIFTYSKYNSKKPDLTNSLEQTYIDKIINSIKSGDTEIAIDSTNKLIYELKASRQSIEHIKNVSVLLCSLSFKLLMNHYVNLSEIVGNSSKTYKDILNCDSIGKLTHILEKVILLVIERLSYLNSQDNYIIKKVTDYIESNFANPVKLNDVAELAHVNSSYLSRLFKKETGSTLTEIVTKIRIEKAKDLLSFSNMKTYEIALKVGIEDPAYFSQVFKKYTGLSPSKFKKLK